MAMTFEQFRDLIGRLAENPAEVTDDELGQARDFARQFPTDGADLETLRAVRDGRNAIRDVQVQREADATERQGILDELNTPDPEPEQETAPEQPQEASQEVPPEQTEPVETTPEPVAASGRRAPIGSIGRTADPEQPPREQVTGQTTASSSTTILAAGEPIPNLATLAEIMATRVHGLTKTRSTDGEKVHVSRTTLTYPESRTLSRKDSFASNFTKIENAASPEALVAAGGICAPLQNLYDIDVLGSSARPIRDALASFRVERGGIQYRPHTSAAATLADQAQAQGVGVWTMDDDEAVGVTEDPDVPDPTKACYRADCPGLQTAEVYAVYLCMEFSNITSMFDPESTASNIRSADIAHARLAENQLLGLINSTSKLLTASAQEVGAVRHMLAEFDHVQAYFRSRHRLEDDRTLTWILPQWVRHLWRADLAYQMAAGDWAEALAPADSLINGWFSRRGVNPVWHLDGSSSDVTVGAVTIQEQVYANAAAESVIPRFPASIDTALFATGTKLFLDAGTLDLGVVRDSVLNSRNSYRQFKETFEGVADRGVESLRVVFQGVTPNGMSAGTIDMFAA